MRIPTTLSKAATYDYLRLDDVENKLLETEKEADKARKESKAARDAFNEIKKTRCVSFISGYGYELI